jgi:hypothetical protein
VGLTEGRSWRRGITQSGETLGRYLGRPSWPPFHFHCSVARHVLLHRLPRMSFLNRLRA